METKTIRELIYWSYANLAMAHSAVSKNQTSYSRINFMVRSRLYKGLINGSLSMRSILDDERNKITVGAKCNYCGCETNLSIDHILPQKYGGNDSAENLIMACSTCNSSKGAKDMMEYFNTKSIFPPLMLLRRYLKLIYQYCEDNNCIDNIIDDVDDSTYPFKLKNIPVNFPKPIACVLFIE